MRLGIKIRDLRLRRGLTVQQLADASDLSKGFISQVENDRTSPSLSTLGSIAAALRTSVAYLVVEEDPAPAVVRAAARRRIETQDLTRVEVLSAEPKRNLEMLLIELPAGPAAAERHHWHLGEECLYCLEGRVRLRYGEQSLELEPGDSCHFDGRTPHILENAGPASSRVLLAMTPAAFDPASPQVVLRASGRNGTSLGAALPGGGSSR